MKLLKMFLNLIKYFFLIVYLLLNLRLVLILLLEILNIFLLKILNKSEIFYPEKKNVFIL